MSGRNYAVLAGCTKTQGCHTLACAVNNVKAMGRIIRDNMGFQYEDMAFLTHYSEEMMDQYQPKFSATPTRDNIMDAVDDMVDNCQSGDVLFFYFSGHGGRHPASNGYPEEEYIVTTEHGVITNHDFRRWVYRLPENVNFTVFTESCHSGGLIDKETEQIGPSTNGRSGEEGGQQNQFVYFDSSFPRMQYRNIPSPISPDNGILLSSCMPDEVARSSGRGQSAHSVFGSAFETAMEEENYAMTNRALLVRIREIISEMGYDQNPCLYCSDENAEKLFLYPMVLWERHISQYNIKFLSRLLSP